MAEGSTNQTGTMEKVKLIAALVAGAILLWFLIVNLWGDPWVLSLWPLAKIPAPGTLFIFIFLLIGFVIGFGLCFYWLRRERVDRAFDALTQEREAEKAGGGQGKEEAAPPGEGS
jgi:hypothetical protein